MILSLIRVARSNIHVHVRIRLFRGWPLFLVIEIELEDY
jgi:hypothetical protein